MSRKTLKCVYNNAVTENRHMLLRNSQIGLIRESSQHAALKSWYSTPTDLIEVEVGGYMIDIVRGNQLIEIQTGNFSSIKKKLTKLLVQYPIRLVYPIAHEKWILKESKDGIISRRKSPKRGRIENIFYELVRLSNFLTDKNFSLEVVFTQEEEIQTPAEETSRCGSWRRKGWVITDRRLIEIIETRTFVNVNDYKNFLFSFNLDEIITSRDLANRLGIPISLAQKMLYCFLRGGLIEIIGFQNRAKFYKQIQPTSSPLLDNSISPESSI